MLTIHCPTCKRVLHAPEESGDHGVVCPGCGVAFAVVFEQGIVRVVSTSVSGEVPSERSPAQLISPAEAENPPVWVPSVVVNVENEEAPRRTRRLHYTFVVATSSCFAFYFYGGAPKELGHDSAGGLVALAFFSVVVGATLTLFVGYFLTPNPLDPHSEREKRLRRMKEARTAALADRTAGDAGPPHLDSPTPNGPPPEDTQPDHSSISGG